MQINENLTSTKFIYAVMASLMGFILVLFNKVDAQAFLTFVNVIGATFIAGNVIAKKIDNDSAN